MREGPWRTGDFPSGDQLRNYTQRYLYDSVGNFVEMAHEAGAGSWTRHYATLPGSNQLQQSWMGNNTAEAVTYRTDKSEANRRWVALVQQIFEVDPLACPSCHGVMRLVAFITQ